MKHFILGLIALTGLSASAQVTGDLFSMVRVDGNVSTLVNTGFVGFKCNNGVRLGTGFLKQTILPHENMFYTDYSTVNLQFRQTYENGNFFYIGPALTRLGTIDQPTMYSYGVEVGLFLLKQ